MAPLLLPQLIAPAPLLLAAPPPPRPGWRLSWAEEFTGPAGSAPNPSHWTVAHNRTHGELEQQLYVSDAVALDGSGNCVLTTDRRSATGPDGHRTYSFTSGWLDTETKVSRAYGRWEVSARLPDPTARGIWPAHWLMPHFAKGSASDWNCWRERSGSLSLGGVCKSQA